MFLPSQALWFLTKTLQGQTSPERMTEQERQLRALCHETITHELSTRQDMQNLPYVYNRRLKHTFVKDPDTHHAFT